MNEIAAAEKWIFNKLSGSAPVVAAVATRIYTDQSQVAGIRPYVFFNLQSGGQDSRGVGTVRVMALPLYQIKLVADGPLDATALAAADAIDDLFQTAVTETSDGLVFSSRRENPVHYPEQKAPAAGFLVHHGGQFRLYIYPVAT